MREMPDILWLEEIRKEDISAVGGKGASLGEMSAIGLPVPRAFVVTSHAFRQFLIESGSKDPICGSRRAGRREQQRVGEGCREGQASCPEGQDACTYQAEDQGGLPKDG